jgi:hypothetical protein
MAFDEKIDGDEDQEALIRIREAEERIHGTPPRCLDGFQVRNGRGGTRSASCDSTVGKDRIAAC